MKILISEPLPPLVHQEVLERLSRVGEVKMAPDTREETFLEEIEDAHAFLVRLARVSARVIERGKELKVIARPAVGVDNVDLEAATRRGIPVVYSPGSNSDSTAEHTLGLILALAKEIPWGHEAAKGGRWQVRQELVSQTVELRGKTLGIIGLGAVGRCVARLARCFGMRVVAHSLHTSPEEAEALGVELKDLDSLLKESDFVTIHVALNPRTRGLIGREELQQMKPGACLVNTARGGIVDEEALGQALEEGRLKGVALDVFSVEPPEPNHPLLQHPRVLVTPHVAGMSRESTRRMFLMAVEDVLRVLAGERPHHVVNREVLN